MSYCIFFLTILGSGASVIQKQFHATSATSIVARVACSKNFLASPNIRSSSSLYLTHRKMIFRRHSFAPPSAPSSNLYALAPEKNIYAREITRLMTNR